MFTSMWFMSLLTLLAVDVRIGAIQQTDKETRKCYVCSTSNTSNSTTSCDQQSSLPVIVCPAGQLCATVASVPNFTSSLQCAAAGDTPCILNYSEQTQTLELLCVCDGHLCNAPFSLEVMNDLLNFSSNISNKTTDLTQTFLKFYSVYNFTDSNLYKMLTVTINTNEVTDLPTQNISKSTTASSTIISLKTTIHLEHVPRAEALKQAATVPSDDDEDENEGSGSYDDTKYQRHPASPPAAPSSLLPANENKSPPIIANLFLKTTILMYFLL